VVGITTGSREVPGRNACDRRHTYLIIIIIIIRDEEEEKENTAETHSLFHILIFLYIPICRHAYMI